MSFEAFRAQLPITEKCIYFQTGSISPTPRTVLESVDRTMQFHSLLGPANPNMHEALDPQVRDAKIKLADFLNIAPEELAWVTNTTQGMQCVIHGLPWEEGDEVVVSSAEHISSRILWKGLAQRFGVKIVVVPTGEDDTTFIEALKNVLNNRTRMISISHVSTLDGRRLPVDEVGGIARERGILTLVDGAQAVGQFPIDLKSQACNFYVASGHKWMFGPLGLGFVYVSRDSLPDFMPNFMPEPDASDDYQRYIQNVTAASRIELGTSSHALPVGLGTAVDLISDMGVDAVEAYIANLVGQIREGLSQMEGIRFVTPEPSVIKGSGLLSFAMDGYDAEAIQRLVRTMLDRHNIIIKYQPEITGIRVSPAGFNTEKEVESFLRLFRETIA